MKILKELFGAKASYHRRPEILSSQAQQHADLDRLFVLAGTAESHPLWKAVLSYADEHARNELGVALKPGLSDAERQFSAGRASSAEDFALALRDLKAAATRQTVERRRD